MGPFLERLDEVAAEADVHRGAGQPLHLELLEVVQQAHDLFGVPRRQLVGPFRAWAGVRPLRSLSAGVGLSR
jgi:hypothetical protein